MPDPDAEFKFIYEQQGDSVTLDAYDASQALYGIARSVSIITHYVINRRVIKQAPSLLGAKVLIIPPQRGSFEFLIPVIQIVTGAAQNPLAVNLFSSFIYDLTKLTFNRLTGRPERPATPELEQILRISHGDVNAIADTINEDITRIHRPIVNNTYNINIYGGQNQISRLNGDTYDYVKSKVVGSEIEEFFGHVSSLNGNTLQGRFWLREEERTVGFSVHRQANLTLRAKRNLSWSLNEWINNETGYLYLRGYPLSSKQNLLKHVFILDAERA